MFIINIHVFISAIAALAIGFGSRPQDTEIKLPFYHPVSVNYQPDIPMPNHLVAPSEKSLIAEAKVVLATSLKLVGTDLKITQNFTDNAKILHVFVIRLIHGISVSNQNAEIRIKNGKVITIYSSITGTPSLTSLPRRSISTETAITLDQAVILAENKYGILRDEFPASLNYVQKPDGSFALVHSFQLRQKSYRDHKWYQVSVDAASGNSYFQQKVRSFRL